MAVLRSTTLRRLWRAPTWSHSPFIRGLFLLGGLVVASGAVAGDFPDEAFVEHVESRVDSGEYVGLIVGFIDGDQTHIRSFGSISKDDDTPPDERTMFEISSVAKTFVATLLARSVTAGRVALDDSANRYLESNARLASYEGTEIRLLDLAAHQSGLPSMPEDMPRADPPNPFADTTRDDLLASINAFAPTSRPGQGYSYSGFAYGVLALILESVNQADVFTLVEHEVTEPLGMHDTVLHLNAEQDTRLATGYTRDGDPAVPLDQGVLRAAGSMYSNLHDLMIWVRANMQPQASPIGEALALTHRIHNEVGTIGLAWHKSEGYDDRSQYGTANGYRAYVGFLADGSKGVVILANTIVDAEALGSRLLLGTELPE